MHCLRLYKEGIDLKLRFKCITPVGGNRLPIHRLLRDTRCKKGAMHLKQSFKSIKNKVFDRLPYIAEGDVRRGNALPSVIYYITEGNRSIASKFCSAKQKIISFALQNLTSPKAMLRLMH